MREDKLSERQIRCWRPLFPTGLYGQGLLKRECFFTDTGSKLTDGLCVVTPLTLVTGEYLLARLRFEISPAFQFAEAGYSQF